jgi:hypothetical protein
MLAEDQRNGNGYSKEEWSKCKGIFIKIQASFPQIFHHVIQMVASEEWENIVWEIYLCCQEIIRCL